jgi:hypothetical protein
VAWRWCELTGVSSARRNTANVSGNVSLCRRAFRLQSWRRSLLVSVALLAKSSDIQNALVVSFQFTADAVAKMLLRTASMRKAGRCRRLSGMCFGGTRCWRAHSSYLFLAWRGCALGITQRVSNGAPHAIPACWAKRWCATFGGGVAWTN